MASVLSIVGCAFLSGDISALSQETAKAVFGRVERVWVGNTDIVLRAKIDTGARTSSLGTDTIETFKRGDQDWVRFSFVDAAGAPVTLVRKVVRFARLKKKNAPGTETRPVVLLKLCVGDVFRLTQVNLVDRMRFDYPVLIGRRFLFGKAVVDIARQYVSEPHCREMSSG